MGELAIEASEIVSRLGQAVEGIAVSTETIRKPATVFLGLEKKHTHEIIQNIHELISTDEDGETIASMPFDSITKLVMVTHSLAAYCGSLERSVLQRLSLRFTTDTSRWVSQMFG